MSGPGTQEPLSAATLERHRQIHFFLDRLGEALEGLHTVGRGDDLDEALRRLPAMLDSVRERLLEHNRDEIDGGLLQGVLDALPETEDTILQLTEEHDRLLDDLAIARIQAERAAVDDVDDVRETLGALVGRLRAHERREEELLERALLQDAPSS